MRERPISRFFERAKDLVDCEFRIDMVNYVLEKNSARSW